MELIEGKADPSSAIFQIELFKPLDPDQLKAVPPEFLS